MTERLSESALDQLFRQPRSIHTFKSDAVTDETLEELYDLLKWGPTAFNAQPGRFLFVRSAAAKGRLAPALSSSNREKSIRAPVTVIVAYDSRFFERLPEHALSERTLAMFRSDAAAAETTAFRNATLQGAYLLLAARALGLAVGPMSGFDAEQVNREFFPDGRHRANFLANIGYADGTPPRPRAPRFEFSEVAEVI